MQEQLISFETAKLAKEKGFDFKVYREEKIYDKLGYLLKPEDEVFPNVEYFPAPTQSLLQKWLREVHKISVESTSCWWDDGKKEFEYNVYKKDLGGDSPCSLSVFKTYEEALEVGLQEALKLIEIVKSQK